MWHWRCLPAICQRQGCEYTCASTTRNFRCSHARSSNNNWTACSTAEWAKTASIPHWGNPPFAHSSTHTQSSTTCSSCWVHPSPKWGGTTTMTGRSSNPRRCAHSSSSRGACGDIVRARWSKPTFRCSAAICAHWKTGRRSPPRTADPASKWMHCLTAPPTPHATFI